VRRDHRSDPVERLRDWFGRGQVVLLAGAGFSHGASDVAGRPIPQVRDLAEEIWGLAYPDEPFPGDADLGDLYEVAMRRSRRALIALMRSRLDVDPESLPEHFSTWLSMPWRIVYTLNVDNLEEAAERAFDMPRSLKPVSALRGELTIGGGGDLACVHINGTRDDIPDATFGPLQYGARNALPEPLYGQLVTDILTFPVVFVGTELRESPLWTYIGLRGPKGPRGVDEKRPRSFLVSPELPRERADLLEGFNIEWIPMSASEFADEVLRVLEPEAKRGLAVIEERGRAQRERVRLEPVLELAALPAEPVSEYLLGARPTWGDLTSGRAVAREFETSVDIDKLPACLVVTGTAGIGTSTTLMQIALRCAAAGRNALWLATRNCAPHEVSREIGRLDDEAYVFIDDADSLGRGLEALIKDVGTLPTVHLVLGMRSGRLDNVLGGWRPDSSSAAELIVPGLEDSDVERLISSLDKDNKLGQLKGLSYEQQRALFIRESGRQLLVAMIKTTSGKELEDKIVSEMRSLDPMQHMVYAVLAIATDFRSRLTRDEVLTAADALSNEGVNALDRLVSRRLVKDVGVESYELRHRLVAEIAGAELRRGGQAFAPYLGLTRVLASKHRPGDRTSRIGRLLIALVNHRRVNAYFDAHKVRALYQELEGFLADDYHFLLQRGSYELDFGSLSLATNYLQQARQLGAGDHRVETEWAHLLMRKACSDPNADDSPAQVEEARTILLDQIDKLGLSDRHAFHVYGSQLLAWTKRSSLSVTERRGELARALEIVESGAERHPGDQDLKSLAEGLKRELLMTAVSS
jgi:hypothetical protein